MRITHVITGLSVGGAEMMLHKYLKAADSERFVSQVISLTDVGEIGAKIQALGVPVRSLGLSPSAPNPLAIFKLLRWIREGRPDIVQTWMYHADLLGGIAAWLAGRYPVIWGIRTNDLDPGVQKWMTLLVGRICALLSGRLPARIACCSAAAMEAHTALGYRRTKMVWLPNGFDLETFKPDAAVHASMRAELRLPNHALITGIIGRYHPQKDYPTCIDAARRVSVSLPKAQYVLCGKGLSWDNGELVTLIRNAGIAHNCHLLGPRSDIARLMASFDAVISSSIGEGFPNVIGEAMACGVPCVVTDAGDSAAIVGETGIVVPPRQPRALAEGWAKMLQQSSAERKRLGALARARIESNFSLQAVVRRYEALFTEVYDERRDGLASARAT